MKENRDALHVYTADAEAAGPWQDLGRWITCHEYANPWFGEPGSGERCGMIRSQRNVAPCSM
jgi:hypothetical protein